MKPSDQNPRSVSEDEYADALVQYHQELLAKDSESAVEVDAKLASVANEDLLSAKRVIDLLANARPKRLSQESTLTAQNTPGMTPQDSDPRFSERSAEQRPRDEEIPSTIGRFEIKDLIGQGGFGLVFLAHDPKLNRSVALKVPQLSSLLDGDAQARFALEGRVLATLSHPGIVPVYEVGCDGPISYIASEFIPGKNLAAIVQQQGVFDAQNSAKIVCELAAAIQHAHSRGVIHRDLKPANILFVLADNALIKDAQVKVTDFGMAKLVADDAEITRTGSIVGTPSYAAPEQLNTSRDVQTTSAVDVYSLGAILYYLLTARAPFESDSIAGTIQAVLREPPPPPSSLIRSVPADLSAICLRCMEKSPQHRYATAHELQQDLTRFLSGAPVVARQLSPATWAWRWCVRHPFVAFIASLIVLSLAAISFLLVDSEKSKQMVILERDRASHKAEQLTDTIERLFIAIANSPSVHMDAAAPLRTRLLLEADILYRQLISDEPDSPGLELERVRTLFRLAELSSLVGDHSKALEIADDVLGRAQEIRGEAIPVAEWLDWYTFSALALNKTGKHSEADERFNIAFRQLNIDPDSYSNSTPEPILELAIGSALARHAYVLLDAGDLTRASKLAKSFLRLCNDVGLDEGEFDVLLPATCHYIQGIVHSAKGDFPSSIAELEAAMELLPYHEHSKIHWEAPAELMVECWLQLGIARANLQQFSAARDSYQRAIELATFFLDENPRLEQPRDLLCSARYSLAVTELMLGNAENAESLILANNLVFEQLSSEDQSNSASHHLRLANNFNLLYGIREQLDPTLASAESALIQAIEHCDMALQRRPEWIKAELDRARAISNLGNIFFLRNEYALAMEQYHAADRQLQGVLDRQPDFGTARHALATVDLSCVKVLVEERKFQEALVHSRKAIERFNGHEPRALVDEAFLLGCLGEPFATYSEFEKLVTVPPQNASLAIYAAHMSCKLADILPEEELDNSAIRFLEEHSFDQLAVQILTASLPANAVARKKFLDSISAQATLADAWNELVP